MKTGLPVPRDLKLLFGVPWFAATVVAVVFPWPLIALSLWSLHSFVTAPE